MSEWFTEFEDFARARTPELVRLARVLTGSRESAEEVVNDVLSKVWDRWRKISKLEAPDAYIKRMVLNQSYSRSRRPAVRHERSVDPGWFEESTVSDHAVTYAARDEMWRALRSLPRRQFFVLALRYYDHLSDEEIALALGISTGTVRSHASHGLSRLRSLLSPEGGQIPS